MKRLEAEGAIRGYQAVLDQRRLGLGVTVFVSVSIERNDTAAHRAFEQAVLGRPEIVACHIVGGQHDFLLHVVAEDLDGYAEFALHVLGQLPGRARDPQQLRPQGGEAAGPPSAAAARRGEANGPARRVRLRRSAVAPAR
mgnify:CR=1 FL=1